LKELRLPCAKVLLQRKEQSPLRQDVKVAVPIVTRDEIEITFPYSVIANSKIVNESRPGPGYACACRSASRTVPTWTWREKRSLKRGVG
jgi:hypothetical protein